MTVKALLIDDDQALLTLNAMFLSLNGFETVSCRNGQEALELFETVRPDVIITDIMMPVMDGTNFLEQLEIKEDGADCPVIILSGVKRSEINIDHLQNSRIEVLQKPFSPDELLERIKALLS
ncbi:MAG: response regulator [Candidatus Electrothrix sp. ATG1]|nr:response regulator [Candidatus Electrothrix sp. ATG1]